jgi:Tfp pilus assembly protein PilZ
VRFWVHGHDQPRQAYIHDISTTGVFVATPYPLPRGTEIRLEIDDADASYIVEAVVARRVWVAPDLRALGPTGMGARFLAPQELVQRFRERGEGRVAGSLKSDEHFLIALEDDRSLLQTYAHDLERGGLFIPTEVPPALNRDVVLDFQFPDGHEPLSVKARVVQRVPAGQSGQALQAGMAVALEDPGPLLDRLRPFLAESGAPAPAIALPGPETEESASERASAPATLTMREAGSSLDD